MWVQRSIKHPVGKLTTCHSEIKIPLKGIAQALRLTPPGPQQALLLTGQWLLEAKKQRTCTKSTAQRAPCLPLTCIQVNVQADMLGQRGIPLDGFLVHSQQEDQLCWRIRKNSLKAHSLLATQLLERIVPSETGL